MGLGDKMFRGLAWSFIDRVSVQAAQFFLGIVLARLLLPEEYGIMAILIVFIVLSQVFIDSGFTKALIQKTDRNEDDKSTVFLFNIGISLACYALLWVAAPFIASFYEIEEITILLRVVSISLIINSLFAVPATLYTIDLDFKTLTKVNLTAVLTSGIIAIYLAYTGYGVWALVYQTIIRAIVAAVFIWIIVKWRPNMRFSKESFNKMFSYGSKLLVSSLLANFFSNLNSLLIGKYVSAKDLGYYSRGIQFSQVVFSIFSSALNSVLLPGLAPIQDQKEQLTGHTRTIIKTSALITVPIFFGLALLAEPIILVLLTEKWRLAIPIMQIFCIARLITIISSINVNILYVIGRTDLVLRQQYINITVRVALVIAALQYGIVWIALAELLATSIHFFVNSYYPGKYMKYGAFKQIKDIMIIIGAGLLMTAISYVAMLFIDSDLLQLIIIPILGASCYLAMVYLLKIPEYFMTLDKVKVFLGKNKQPNTTDEDQL